MINTATVDDPLVTVNAIDSNVDGRFVSLMSRYLNFELTIATTIVPTDAIVGARYVVQCKSVRNTALKRDVGAGSVVRLGQKT